MKESEFRHNVTLPSPLSKLTRNCAQNGDDFDDTDEDKEYIAKPSNVFPTLNIEKGHIGKPDVPHL